MSYFILIKKSLIILLISKSSIINLVLGFRLNQRLLLSTLVSYWTAIYLGIKAHIDYISLKISKTIGIISRLRYYLPLPILLNICRSLIYPYITYGLVVWGQAAQMFLNKILVLQKRVLRIMNFSTNREHAIPLFNYHL
jgi:hypothetical protein